MMKRCYSFLRCSFVRYQRPSRIHHSYLFTKTMRVCSRLVIPHADKVLSFVARDRK